jgi:hydrogenase maturation factor HypF (carbamoyltransferase family)
MSRSPGRGGHAWRKVCAIVLSPHVLVCIRCGYVIDKTLRWPHPFSKSVDHRVDLVDGGDPLDISNLGPAHLGCNSRAGRKAQWARQRAQRQAHGYARMVVGLDP